VIGNDCRCPGCGTCDAASEVSDLRKSLREWKQKHAELSRMNTSYIKHLHAAERERDALKARVERMTESMSMACEEPSTGCECAGCSYARERGGDHE
jgi:predicted nuclease with TOPRIM domain